MMKKTLFITIVYLVAGFIIALPFVSHAGFFDIFTDLFKTPEIAEEPIEESNDDPLLGAPSNGAFYFAETLRFSTTTTGCLEVQQAGNSRYYAYITGTDCGTGSGSSFGQAWEINSLSQLAPTTTIDVLLNNKF